MSATTITYRVGDATRPIGGGDGPKIIAHVCNDVGAWGAGFVLAISKRWLAPERKYRALKVHALGQVQLVFVETGVLVCNMIAQHGFPTAAQPCALDYEELRRCLSWLADRAKYYGASVHMPRIGCGIAGGEWSRVSAIVEQTLCAAGVPVTVYDLTALEHVTYAAAEAA